MHLSDFVDAVKTDLARIAELGDDQAAVAAQRLADALQGTLALRLLDVLSAAAAELNAQLPAGRVEVRLAGQDPELVYVDDAAAPSGGDDAFTARITLRLPEALKREIETAAEREGVSVNAWVVRALARRTSARRSDHRLTGFGLS